MRRFAEDTEVPVARSRGEIEKLLKDWGVDGMSWGDDFKSGVVTLHFIWEKVETRAVGGQPLTSSRFTARVCFDLEPVEALRKKCLKPYSGGQIHQAKFEKLMAARGRREHRVLLLWLKAAFNAIDSHIISAEELFLPFLEGPDGRTVGQVALPRLRMLLTENADRLLPAKGGT
jgi:hypothetical protein